MPENVCRYVIFYVPKYFFSPSLEKEIVYPLNQIKELFGKSLATKCSVVCKILLGLATREEWYVLIMYLFFSTI